MPNALWTRIIILLAAGTWFVAALLMGVPVDQEWTKPLGLASSVVVLLLLAFDSILWKFLPYKLVRVPKLGGTWKATLQSSFKDTDGEAAQFACFLVVRQTYSSIHIEMLFPKSESVSTSASIIKTDGTSELWYSYRSEAHSLDRDGNPPHKGAVQLRIAMNGDTKLAGGYWTDRQTYGCIETVEHKPTIINDYKTALGAFDN
ncbi:MAG: hypothetical protein ABIR57_08685 [Aeromicrobium sp.]